MSFDQINSLSTSQISDAYAFLGSSTSGLGALANNFTAITDPIGGVITLQQNDYTTEDQHLSDRITTMTQQATLAQNALTAKVQAQTPWWHNCSQSKTA